LDGCERIRAKDKDTRAKTTPDQRAVRISKLGWREPT
jgi:hypothetical protein